MACNCLVGTAVEGKDGSCTCINNTTISNEPITTPIPIQSTPLRNAAKNRALCAGLQAPNGYEYMWTGQQCALVVNYDTDTRVPASASSLSLQSLISWLNPTANQAGVVDTTQPATIGGEISTLYAQHPALFLGAAGVVAWYLLKGKRGARSRYVTERDSY